MKKTSMTLARASAACLIATGILLLGTHASAQSAVPVTVTTIDFPIGGDAKAAATFAHDINDAGTIVGSYQLTKDGAWHGFVGSYHDGTYQASSLDVDFPGAVGTQALGINNRGDIVGLYTVASDSFSHGFLYHAAAENNGAWFEKIDQAGAFNTMPEDVNDAGYVVGCIHNNGLMTSFVWKDGRFLSISTSYSMFTSVNEAGTAIGYEFTPPAGNQSFSVSGVDRVEFAYTDVPNKFTAMNTYAWGLNQVGDIVGNFSAGRSKGFVRSHDGTLSAFTVSGATGGTWAYGINEAGTIVGGYQVVVQQTPLVTVTHAFLWTK